MKHAGAGTVYQAFYLEWMAFLDGVRNQQASHIQRSQLPSNNSRRRSSLQGRETQPMKRIAILGRTDKSDRSQLCDCAC